MGASKIALFDKKCVNLAKTANALGHPARLEIIDLLRSKGYCNANEFLKYIPLAQPTIAQHLSTLRDANIVKFCVVKNTVIYNLNHRILREFQDHLNEIIRINQKNAA